LLAGRGLSLGLGEIQMTAELEGAWEDYLRLLQDVKKAAQLSNAARDRLVSQLCFCYREDEPWDDRAIWCSHRITGKCPFYLEFAKRQSQ